MAAITSLVNVGWSGVVRQATAQANTGQTDWVVVPAGADSAVVDLFVSAVGGTTPGPTTPRLKTVNYPSPDDANAAVFATDLTGTIATTGRATVAIGAGNTQQVAIGVAACAVNYPLPAILGIQLTFDRTNADETYTYTLAVRFSG